MRLDGVSWAQGSVGCRGSSTVVTVCSGEIDELNETHILQSLFKGLDVGTLGSQLLLLLDGLGRPASTILLADEDVDHGHRA